jgi:hypothetical protein
MTHHTAICHACTWKRDAASAEPEALAEAAVALEDHLAGTHDLSYPRAQELARQWARMALFAEGEDAPTTH